MLARKPASAAVLAMGLVTAPATADVTDARCETSIAGASYYQAQACTFVSREPVSAHLLTRTLTLTVTQGYAMATLNCEGVSPALVLLAYDYDSPKTLSRVGAGYCTADVRSIDYTGGTTTAHVVAW